MELKKVIINVKPKMKYDSYSGEFIVFDGLNKGGAIMSDHDPLLVVEKFKHATRMCCVIRSMLEFNEHMGAVNHNNVYVPMFID